MPVSLGQPDTAEPRLAALDLAAGGSSTDSPGRALVSATRPTGHRLPFRSSWGATGHVPALDGMRGLAILMVLLHHFVAQTSATNRFEAVVNWVCSYGSLGVDLFFVLSGFLITG